MLPPRSPMSEKTPSIEQVQNSPPLTTWFPPSRAVCSIFTSHYSAILSVCFSLCKTHPAIQHHVLPQAKAAHLLSKSLGSPGSTWQCSQEPRSGCHTCMISHLLAGMQKLWWMESPENSPISDMQICSANAAKINNVLKKPVSRLCLCMKWSHQNRMFDSIRPFNKSEASPWERTQGSQES